MKKKVISGFVLLFLLQTTVLAQSPTTEKPVKTGNEWKMPADVSQRATIFADNLKNKLDLDSSQTKKIYTAFLANTKPLDEISVLAISDEDKKQRLKANKTAFDATIKGILLPAQFDRYQKMEAGKKN